MMKILFAVSFTVVLAACASTPSPTSQDEFSRLAAQTENEIRQAEKTGFLWRDTEKLLQEARQTQKAGQHDQAMKLARQAIKQAQLAQQQAKQNANAGPVYPAP